MVPSRGQSRNGPAEEFSLGTMILVATVVCVWLAVQVNRAHRQRDALAAIESLGGRVAYDDEDTDAPGSPCRKLVANTLGKDYAATVVEVTLMFSPIQDAGCVHLRDLTEMRYLDLESTRAAWSRRGQVRSVRGDPMQALHSTVQPNRHPPDW